jgi:hypothetical protein
MGNDPRACAIVPTGNTLANVSGWLLPMIGFALREITGVYARKALVRFSSARFSSAWVQHNSPRKPRQGSDR